jgi:hypothetical protein
MAVVLSSADLEVNYVNQMPEVINLPCIITKLLR